MSVPTREAIDPPVQGAEYPKMLYRDGEGKEHVHIDKPLLVENEHQVDCTLVWNLDEEMLAMEEGSRLTANPKGSPRREDARDAEIRRLRELVERSPGMSGDLNDASHVARVDPTAVNTDLSIGVARRPGRPRKEVGSDA